MDMDFIKHSIIVFLLLNIIFQLIITFKYNWKFILQYLVNEKSNWNPKIDRIKLFACIIFIIVTFIIMVNVVTLFSSKRIQTTSLILWDIISISIACACITLFSILSYTVINMLDISKKKLLKFKPLQESIHEELKEKIISEKRAIVKDLELQMLSEGKELEFKLKWIDKIGQNSTSKSKNGDITYGHIFDLFHEYFIEGGIYPTIKGDKRKELINYIIENISKDGDEIKYSTLYKSYTEWTPKESK